MTRYATRWLLAVMLGLSALPVLPVQAGECCCINVPVCPCPPDDCSGELNRHDDGHPHQTLQPSAVRVEPQMAVAACAGRVVLLSPRTMRHGIGLPDASRASPFHESLRTVVLRV